MTKPLSGTLCVIPSSDYLSFRGSPFAESEDSDFAGSQVQKSRQRNRKERFNWLKRPDVLTMVDEYRAKGYSSRSEHKTARCELLTRINDLVEDVQVTELQLRKKLQRLETKDSKSTVSRPRKSRR